MCLSVLNVYYYFCTRSINLDCIQLKREIIQRSIACACNKFRCFFSINSTHRLRFAFSLSAAALGNVVHHFTAASGPLLHAHVVSTLHGTVTSSTIVMATAPQVAPSATSHHREGLIFTAGQSVQPAVTPQVGSMV